MTDLEVAWVAGLFEGEGSLSRHRPQANSSWRMSLRMADEDVVLRLQALCGGQVYFENRWKQRKATYKDMWSWQLGVQAEISVVVGAIYPFMGSRRKAKMDEFRLHFAKPSSQSKSENAKARWADPDYRARMTAERQARWQNPEFRARMMQALNQKRAGRSATAA